MSALLGILGVVLDARFGEPQGWHPLVAFGRLADRLERRFNPAWKTPTASAANCSACCRAGRACRSA